MAKCAPDKKFTDGSCYTTESLQAIANAYNSKLLSDNYNKHNMSKENLIKISNNRNSLLQQLRTRLKNFCNNDEQCWSKLNFVKSLNDLEIEKFTFRPKGPQGQWAWLNTNNITEVMEQFMNKYRDFKFLGTVPIDFQKLPVLGISNLNFEELENEGYTKFGLVINTDEHYKSGQHWIAVFIDTNYINNDKVGRVYFFDSVGVQPERRVIEFLAKSVKYIMKKYNKKRIRDLDIKYNNVQHQKKNTECGVYSINFLLRLLKGESYDEIIQRRMSDEEVNKCRSVYFNKTIS
jgi:hypothetical protein